MTQKVNDMRLLRLLDCYYILICQESLSHVLSLLKLELIVYSKVDGPSIWLYS